MQSSSQSDGLESEKKQEGAYVRRKPSEKRRNLNMLRKVSIRESSLAKLFRV